MLAQFLDCVEAAARIGLEELDRLQKAEAKASELRRTARSRLSDAVGVALRLPVVTRSELAGKLNVSGPAAQGLLRQMMEAGIVREATGRAAWRAFALA